MCAKMERAVPKPKERPEAYAKKEYTELNYSSVSILR